MSAPERQKCHTDECKSIFYIIDPFKICQHHWKLVQLPSLKVIHLKRAKTYLRKDEKT